MLIGSDVSKSYETDHSCPPDSHSFNNSDGKIFADQFEEIQTMTFILTRFLHQVSGQRAIWVSFLLSVCNH